MTSKRKLTKKAVEHVTGTSLMLDSAASSRNLTHEIAGMLRMCFPAVQTMVEDTHVLQDGLGFHDMEDTTWILLWGRHDGDIGIEQENRSDTTKNDAIATKKSPWLIGLITVIPYHNNGFYLCNFCVAPNYQREGCGLDLLEEATQFAVVKTTGKETEHSLTLIGHASVDCTTQRSKILQYYQNLGAQVVVTGVGSKNNRSGSFRSWSSSTVRLERTIPSTESMVIQLFQDLRSRRQQRQRRQRWLWSAATVAVTIAMVGSLCIVTERKGSTNKSTGQTSQQ